MITSIFSKSKPINFLIVFVITGLAFLTVKMKYVQQPLNYWFILKQIATFSTAYLSVLLLNFIATKNELTQKNNFEILLFSLFLLLIPESLISASVIWANFFVLLALRRLLSLRSQKKIKSKLFDATLLIGIASLFYFWALLFFILVPLVLLFHSSNNIKHWIIPLAGLATILILSISVSIVLNNTYFDFINTNYQWSFDFNNYNSLSFLIALTLLFSFGFWSAFYYLRSFRKKIRNIRPAYKTIFATLLIAFTIILISPYKNGKEFLFLFAPLSIVVTNYIEIIKEKWFKEAFFGILFITPFVLLMLQFFSKS